MRARLLAAVAMVAMSGPASAQARAPHHRVVRHRTHAATSPAPAPAPRAAIVRPAPVAVQMAPAVPAGPQQSLREALVRTYASNPTLMAQRQSLRATDESVDI